mgnify:CR=1 FL=1
MINKFYDETNTSEIETKEIDIEAKEITDPDQNTHPIPKDTRIYDPPHIPDQSMLRDYQKECISKIESCNGGSHLIVLPTGSGKTVVLSHIPRHGRVLLLSHRDELVHQPEKYYDCSFGVEQAKEHSNGEEVVSASVQSLIRRLNHFDPYDFDMIITDEAHHAVASSYRKIYDYFKPRIHLGFTATPDRADKNDLNQIYDDILYLKDMKWGIREGFLTDIDCYQIDVGYDLTQIKNQMGDYKLDALADEMLKPTVVDAVVDAYQKHRKGQTLMFAVNVAHADALAKKIPGSVVVTGMTPKEKRAEILENFRDRKIPCMINIGVFTEGTDIPLIETVVLARPTQSEALFCQMVGRGLRPAPGKESLTLIDCVGVSKKAPANIGNLFGLNMKVVPKKKQNRLQGVRITEMENTIEAILDGPDSWINTETRVKLFCDENSVDLRDVNFVPMGNNSLVLSLGTGKTIYIPETDALGKTQAFIEKRENNLCTRQKITTAQKLQSVVDDVRLYLMRNEQESKPLWYVSAVNTWGRDKASSKQIDYIKVLAHERMQDLNDIDLTIITKKQASVIIERLNAMPKKRSLCSNPNRGNRKMGPASQPGIENAFSGTKGWY